MVIFAKRIGCADTNKHKHEYEHTQARKLLAYALMSEYSIDITALTEVRTKHGKPYFENCPVKFSISHSEEYAVCALSDFEIGCDIEKMRNVSNAVLVRFVGKSARGDFENIKLFTEYESFAKLIGVGIPLSKEQRENMSSAFYKTYDCIDGYLLTVSSFSDDFPEKIIIV